MLPLPDDLYYMPYGRPAVATVTFVGTPAAGNTLTINGVVYTFGTDWGSRFSGSFTPNYVPGSSVRDLAELINGVDDQGRGSLALLPNATVFARAAGNKLLLFAREPGTAGNSYTLSTNNSAAFVVSGATFSGGTAGSAGGGSAVTIANGADVALGSKEDVAQTDVNAAASLIAFTKGSIATVLTAINRLDLLLVSLGVPGNAAITDYTISDSTANEIAILKGLLKILGAPVTNNFATITTGSQVIPIGAKGWSAIFMTGTGTVNSQAVSAGASIGDPNITANTVTIAVDADSSAFVRWNTFP